MEEGLRKITQMVLEYFYRTSKRENINLKIEYVDNLYARRLELAHNDNQRSEIISNKRYIENLNGTMVLPTKNGELSYILISKAILNDTYFIGTIIHELTHIYDFMDFARDFCDDDYEVVYYHKHFWSFYNWSEFNARRKGYFYYREIQLNLLDKKPNNEEQLEHILNTELKFHNDRLLNDLEEYPQDKDKQKYFYSLIQFMGRFSVWEDLFPAIINPIKYLPDYLLNTYGTKIITLYVLLHSMEDFNLAKEKLSLLKVAIDELRAY